MNNIFLKNVLLKTLTDNRLTILWWSIGITLFNLLVMGFYPSFGDNTQYLDLVKQMPPALVKGFIGEVGLGPATYLNGKLYLMILPFIFIIFNILFGSQTLADEEKKGTLDLVLSTQIPRWRLVLEKFLALIVLNIILGFVSFISVMGGAVAVNATLNAGHVLAISLSLTALGILFGSLAMGIAAICGNKQISLGLAGAVAVATYMLNALAPLSTQYAHLQKLSPFYYYLEHNPLVNGLKFGDFSVLIICAIVFIIIGLFVFQKRDLVTN